MARSLVLSNGHLLVAMDELAQVRDIFYHYVGLENHIGRFPHRIGIFTEGKLNWIDGPDWEIIIDYQEDTLVGQTVATNLELKIKIKIEDAVYNEKDIFLRGLEIENLADKAREIKVFFNQGFEVGGVGEGNSIFFDPRRKAIVHYKGRRVFLISGLTAKNLSFDDYATGMAHFQEKEGTFRDAEDGVLSKNPVEHGPVDSTIGFTLRIEPKTKTRLWYWIIAAKGLEEAWSLNAFLQNKTPAYILESTADFWHAWVSKRAFDYADLSPRVISLFKKSLLILRTHTDATGPILASTDTEILQYEKDSYCYVWPRDAVFVALAFDRAGYYHVAQRFFTFCNEVISKEGYLMHKYLPDRSLGSSWHAWVEDGKPQLPIQEDETALVIWALWQHYQIDKDIEFIESIYNSLIKRAADFMVAYRLEDYLPKPSYDIWEEKLGIFTFTAASVYAGLAATCRFATLLGKEEDAACYQKAAAEVQQAIINQLLDKDKGIFFKGLVKKGEEWVADKTIDTSSFWGLFEFEVLSHSDPLLEKFAQVIQERLGSRILGGGIARYENDRYHNSQPKTIGNPWFICQLWLLEYRIAIAKTRGDLAGLKGVFEWVVSHALPSGMLSEQLDGQTGRQVSVSPLMESHAFFVLTVIGYLEKFKKLE